MPPTHEPPHGHSKPSHKEKPEHEAKASTVTKSSSAKKGKPSFDVSADAGTSDAGTGWVFRDSEEPSHGSKKSAAAAPAASGKSPSKSDSVLAAATEVFVLSAIAVGFAALATIRLLEVPMAAGRMVLPDRKPAH